MTAQDDIIGVQALDNTFSQMLAVLRFPLEISGDLLSQPEILPHMNGTLLLIIAHPILIYKVSQDIHGPRKREGDLGGIPEKFPNELDVLSNAIGIIS